MITRREFLTRSVAAFAGAAVVSSGLATPALANHNNGETAQAKARRMLKDGSGNGTPAGHPQNHGEISQRSEGTPVLGGTPRTPENRGKQAGGFAGDCPNADGECPYGTGECPNVNGECPYGNGECDGSGPDD